MKIEPHEKGLYILAEHWKEEHSLEMCEYVFKKWIYKNRGLNVKKTYLFIPTVDLPEFFNILKTNKDFNFNSVLSMSSFQLKVLCAK